MNCNFIMSLDAKTTQSLLSQGYVLLYSKGNNSIFINNKDIVLKKENLKFLYSDTLTF